MSDYRIELHIERWGGDAAVEITETENGCPRWQRLKCSGSIAIVFHILFQWLRARRHEATKDEPDE